MCRLRIVIESLNHAVTYTLGLYRNALYAFLIGGGEKRDTGHEPFGPCQSDPALCSVRVQERHHPRPGIVSNTQRLIFLYSKAICKSKDRETNKNNIAI